MTREHGSFSPRSKPIDGDFFEKPSEQHAQFNGRLRDLFGRNEVDADGRPFSPSMNTRITRARSAKPFTVIEPPLSTGGAA